jgi:hypothetical protein
MVSIGLAETTNIEEMIDSGDPMDRIQGYYDMVNLEPESGHFGDLQYSCKFKLSDSIAAKTLVIKLLKKEHNFDFDKYYYDRYGLKISGDDIYKRKKEDKVLKYLYAKEAYGGYLADLYMFVDSCEDESIIDIFPGQKTFDKYPQQSVEKAFEKIEKTKNSNPIAKNVNAHIIRLIGASTIKYKKNNTQLYNKVKVKLMELVEDNVLCDTIVKTMGQIGDPDFIPILKRLSKYDDSKGSVMIIDGRKKIFPISRDAKEALNILQKSTTTQ